VATVREKLTFTLSWMFAFLGMTVLISGSMVFFLFALGMVAGAETGARLAAGADRIMGFSLWLAVLATVIGMLQMYAARESALQMDGDAKSSAREKTKNQLE
jgi:hypothetical protein